MCMCYVVLKGWVSMLLDHPRVERSTTLYSSVIHLRFYGKMAKMTGDEFKRRMRNLMIEMTIPSETWARVSE